MMEYSTTTQWQNLYAIVNEWIALAPWQWLQETDLIGVQVTTDAEPVFVSIAGQMGNEKSATLYIGAEGLHKFRYMQAQMPNIRPEQVLTIPHMTVSLEDRETLTTRDRKLIKQLGLRYRGRQAWPLIRSVHPGYAPWYLTPEEVHMMTQTLRAVTAVSRAMQQTGFPKTPSDDHVVVMVPGEASVTEWQITFQIIPAPPPRQYRIPVDPIARAHLHDVNQTGAIVDVGFYWMPSPVGEKGERPAFPYSLILMEPTTGIILGHELLVADPTPVEMWSSIPLRLIQALAKMDMKPHTLRTADGRLQPFLNIVAQEYGFELKIVEHLPQLDALARGLVGFVG